MLKIKSNPKNESRVCIRDGIQFQVDVQSIKNITNLFPWQLSAGWKHFDFFFDKVIQFSTCIFLSGEFKNEVYFS